jgi:cytochrome P450
MALLARQKRAALVLVTTLFFGNARTLLTMPTPPVDDTVTIDDLTRDPYTVYKRFRAESPVIRVNSARRTLLVKAADTKYVKDNPVLFSSDDPSTPMKRAFQFHTLMRKDGAPPARAQRDGGGVLAVEHQERVAADLMKRWRKSISGGCRAAKWWTCMAQLSAPVSARCLAHLIGLTHASDEDLCRWSQTLIDGAGNFGWRDEPFERSDAANVEINACIGQVIEENRAEAQAERDFSHAARR